MGEEAASPADNPGERAVQYASRAGKPAAPDFFMLAR